MFVYSFQIIAKKILLFLNTCNLNTFKYILLKMQIIITVKNIIELISYNL